MRWRFSSPLQWPLLLAGGLAAQTDEAARLRMVKEQIEARGVQDAAVLRAMRATPRHLFVPVAQQALAYKDSPLPIGHGQTISQPYIVGSMSQLLGVRAGDKVLEIGTGSGYQAAILSQLAARVFSIEIVDALAKEATARLRELGYANVTVRAGDGYAGWPEEAPFDRIILTAAPPELPRTLVEQLKPGGRLVAPVGTEWQELVVVEKDAQGRVHEQKQYGVMFVPMVRKAR